MVKHKNILFSLAGAFLLLFSIGLQAAGLGKLTLLSALGQPFQAEIDFVAVPQEELSQVSARVASPEAYREANIEYVGAVGAIKFSVEQRANGQPYLKASSTQPINEPFLELLIEVVWPSGKLLREYPILLDPPEVRAERTPAAELPPSPATATPPSEEKPAAAPADARTEPARAPEAQARSEETYGPIKRGETLVRIARALRPADVDLDQMLVALYRENRGAFIGKNMNLLKTGQMLKVPDLEEIKNVSATEARREIRSHTKRWTDYRARLASNVAKASAQGTPPTQAAAGEVTAKATDEVKPDTEGKDTLKLSKGQGPGDKVAAREDPKAIRDRLNTLQEEATARENALKEANSRVVELEKTVQNLQKLLEMKSETLAQQPGAPSAPPAAQAPAPQEPSVTSPAPTQAPTPEQAQAPARPKKPVVVAAPEEEPSLMDGIMGAISQTTENPMVLGGAAAALIVGVGGLWFVRKRRERQLGAFSATGTAGSSSTVPVSTDKKSGLVETSESAFLSEFNKVAPGSAESDEVDPVAEADVYLAYGRDAQAEEILKEAMARDSKRHEIAVKLLEIYAGRKSVGAFESVARQLHSAIGEGHPLWTRVAEMGRGIDPGNALYGALAAAAVESFSESPAEKTNVVRFPERAQSSDAPMDLSVASAKGDAARSTPGNLDFDLSFSQMGKEQAATTASAPSSVELEMPAAGAGGGGVDFDFDALGRGGEAANDGAAQKPAAGNDPFAIDIDLEKTAARSMLEFPEDAMHGAEETARIASTPAFGSKPAGVDLSRINLNLDTPGASVATTNVGGVSEAALRTVATKLDLAKAYLELGDKQGAKEILDEVIKEGSNAQQQEARKLAEQL